MIKRHLSPSEGKFLFSTGAWLVFRTLCEANSLIGSFELRVYTEGWVLLGPYLSTDEVFRLHRGVVFG